MKILYFASLRDRLGTSAEELHLSEPVTLCAFVEKHIVPRLGASSLIYAVNEEMANGDTLLKNGDVLAVFPPFSGG